MSGPRPHLKLYLVQILFKIYPNKEILQDNWNGFQRDFSDFWRISLVVWLLNCHFNLSLHTWGCYFRCLELRVKVEDDWAKNHNVSTQPEVQNVCLRVCPGPMSAGLLHGFMSVRVSIHVSFYFSPPCRVSRFPCENFFFFNFGGHTSFCETAGTLVLDSSWCRPWVSKPLWIPKLCALSLACSGFRRLTSGEAPADLLRANIVAKHFWSTYLKIFQYLI